MKLVWATDIHLDHVPAGRAKDFADECADSGDAVVLSGDIATHPDAEMLRDFAAHVKKPVYFVLGNHDFWGGSFETTERYIRQICGTQKNLYWLTESSPIRLTDEVQLCGVDGWYDARIGDWDRSPYEMEWHRVRDFHELWPKSMFVAACRALAQRYAQRAENQLRACTVGQVFFATHVPPYDQVSRHDGEPNSWLSKPWYTSVTMGEELSAVARAYPDRQFTTICGHSHDRAKFQEAPNHLVLCGRSVYGSPRVSKVFDL